MVHSDMVSLSLCFSFSVVSYSSSPERPRGPWGGECLLFPAGQDTPPPGQGLPWRREPQGRKERSRRPQRSPDTGRGRGASAGPRFWPPPGGGQTRPQIRQKAPAGPERSGGPGRPAPRRSAAADTASSSRCAGPPPPGCCSRFQGVSFSASSGGLAWSLARRSPDADGAAHGDGNIRPVRNPQRQGQGDARAGGEEAGEPAAMGGFGGVQRKTLARRRGQSLERHTRPLMLKAVVGVVHQPHAEELLHSVGGDVLTREVSSAPRGKVSAEMFTSAVQDQQHHRAPWP